MHSRLHKVVQGVEQNSNAQRKTDIASNHRGGNLCYASTAEVGQGQEMKIGGALDYPT